MPDNGVVFGWMMARGLLVLAVCGAIVIAQALLDDGTSIYDEVLRYGGALWLINVLVLARVSHGRGHLSGRRFDLVVHYGGVAADMEAIGAIASAHGLRIIEDNAHALGGKWRGQYLGTLGALGTQSFHDTKNVHCGEGGALLVNDASLKERAEMIREKGTNRSRFLRGQIDKYTWTDIGSSYLMSELNAAVLDSQLAEFDAIQAKRHAIWDAYSASLVEWASASGASLMIPADDTEHTAHLFYVLMPNHEEQLGLLAHLRERGIVGTFHYIPLDSSPAGLRYGRTPFECSVSEDFSRRMVRLPLWAGMPASNAHWPA
jgi:dTDP-4-amino-4,6-dideoxygalactose transaminase